MKSYKELKEKENEIFKILSIGTVTALVVMLITGIINEFIIQSELLVTLGTISLAVAALTMVVLFPLLSIVYTILETKSDEEQGSK